MGIVQTLQVWGKPIDNKAAVSQVKEKTLKV